MSTIVQLPGQSSHVSADMIAAYRKNGFVCVRNIISTDEAAHFLEAALHAEARMKTNAKSDIFTQLVNVWTQDETLKHLTLHPHVLSAARALAGVPLRLWHDHLLMKRPRNAAATEFHQDQPYWPHAHSTHTLSAWIALNDVPPERGCMTFIPGSQSRQDLPMQNLTDASSLFNICPDLRWEQRVTIPLRAGDCTFHHGRCAHMANPNTTDELRVALAVIYMDATTTYAPIPHPVTDGLNLQANQPLCGDLFPDVDPLMV